MDDNRITTDNLGSSPINLEQPITATRQCLLFWHFADGIFQGHTGTTQGTATFQSDWILRLWGYASAPTIASIKIPRFPSFSPSHSLLSISFIRSDKDEQAGRKTTTSTTNPTM